MRHLEVQKMSDFEKLKERYSALYEFELSRNRLIVNLIDVEAFGYEVACIVAYATIQGKLVDNLIVDEETMITTFGIDNFSLEEAIKKADDMNLLQSEKISNGYRVTISKELIKTLRDEVAHKRLYPKLLERSKLDREEIDD